MFFSTKNGGIAPRWLRSAVRVFIDRAHGRDLFVGDERHRRDAVGVVAVLAAPLQDGRDIFRERDVGCRRLGACAETDQRDGQHRARDGDGSQGKGLGHARIIGFAPGARDYNPGQD